MKATVHPARAAFSMIEIIVVVVILAILAGAIVPRVAGWSRRNAEAAAARAGEVLSAAARREMLSGQTVAVDFDPKARGLRLLVLTGSDWSEDPLVPPADLGDVQLTSAVAGTAALEPSRWRVEFRASEPRPAMAIVLAGDGGRDRWRVDLPAGSARAVVSRGDAAPAGLESIDLDAVGRGDQAW